MILLLDNYDSFTYNLLHLVSQLTDEEVQVIRNDEFEVSGLHDFSRIILSPGPGLPIESGCMMDVIHAAAGSIPLLGVCLGHQAIAQHFGCRLHNLEVPFHGVAKDVIVMGEEDWIYDGIPKRFKAGRYHSWVVDPDSLSETLLINAIDEDGNVMGISDRSGMIKGIQFHPESVLTADYGLRLLSNWISRSGQV